MRQKLSQRHRGECRINPEALIIAWSAPRAHSGFFIA
jgi:hypothetical protein